MNDGLTNEAFESLATQVIESQPQTQPIEDTKPLENVAETTSNETTPTEVVNSNPEVVTESKFEETFTETKSETKPTEIVSEQVVDVKSEAERLLSGEIEVQDTRPAPEPVYDEDYIKYRELLKDPQVQAVLEARTQGKSVTDLIKEINADDPSKLNAKELYEKELDKFGLSEEEKELEFDKFDGMSPLERAKLIQPIKEKLTNDFNSKLELFVNSTKTKAEESQKLIQLNAQEGVSKLEAVLAQKDFMGLELTPERKSQIKKFVEENCFPDKNGKYNVEQTFKAAILEKYADELVRANRKDVEAKAKMEVFKEVTRPSKEATSTSAASLAGQSDDNFTETMRGLHDYSL